MGKPRKSQATENSNYHLSATAITPVYIAKPVMRRIPGTSNNLQVTHTSYYLVTTVPFLRDTHGADTTTVKKQWRTDRQANNYTPWESHITPTTNQGSNRLPELAGLQHTQLRYGHLSHRHTLQAFLILPPPQECISGFSLQRLTSGLPALRDA